jgi:hypothetical protein
MSLADGASLLEEILELPGNIQHSELQFFTPSSDQALSLPKGMAWMTGRIFYRILPLYYTDLVL